MKRLLVVLCAAILLGRPLVQDLMAQGRQDQSNTPTFRATSTLVFLDVTVLDKTGRPVVTGLTKDDFTITEDKKPQRIFSFEAPETHVMGPDAGDAGDNNPAGKAPVTIFVLDLLNSSFEDFGYIRYEVRRFLMAQPPQLTSPAELMVNGNESLDMLHGYTRSRADLLYALDHLPAALPFKATFFGERASQSMDALRLIALQNRGVPGRKNIIWVGHGGPSLAFGVAQSVEGKLEDELKQYVHSTTNMLVDARISLFVIYPSLPGALQHLGVLQGVQSSAEMSAYASIGDDGPFAGDINFGVFVNESGGKLFYNRNDLDTEIKQSERIGSEYYTLTYQPQDVEPDGKFRRIRVTLRDRNLRAVTKVGYFAPDKNMPNDAQQANVTNLANAAQSSIPFNELNVSLSDVVRHPDSGTAEFTVQLKSRNLIFLPTDDSRNTANLILAAASLDKDGRFLASRIHTLTLLTQDMRPLPDVVSSFQLTIPVPRKTQRVRVVIQNEDGGRIGTADLDRKKIDAAPATPTREPQLTKRPEQAPTPYPQRQ